MTNDTTLESSCALLLESAKKFANLQKLNFYRKIQLYIKMFEKKFVQKMKNYTFQICKKFCKILNNLTFNQEKLKMCKFPLTGCL